MKKLIIFFVSIFQAASAFANVNYIDISKISKESKFKTAFNDIRDHLQFYDHWTNEWTYDTPKQELITKLREHYITFSSVTDKSTELSLLLGDISHYLYNLDDTAYYSRAVSNYKAAIISSPKDYRCYWFLGYHYSLSNVPVLAIDNFTRAEKLLPADQPADFWNDFAWATAVANMPSHCFLAMDKVKAISGKESSFEAQLGESIHKRIEPVDKDQSYDKSDLWTMQPGANSIFTSRPLGIKVLVDSSWNLSAYNYSKGLSAFIIKPPVLTNKKGKEIHYTIAILMKTAGDNDKLDDYINPFISKYTGKTKISFSKKYDKMVAYEILDPTMYQDIGGGHLYMIGIERTAPKYPGLLLEEPLTLDQAPANEVSYYSPSSCKDRFKGKIFYAIMLDSCDDINEQSLAIFKSMFENQIVIE